MKTAREFSVLGPLMGGFGSQAFLGCVHDVAALKPAVFVFIPDEILGDAERFKKLWQETERASEIDHVNVIGVLGVARLEEGYARVVEYADAESLRSVYRRAQTMKQPLPANIAVSLVADACMGVHYAHELGLEEMGTPWVHGGVRPETLQVSFAGMAKVTGYGAQVLADTFRKQGQTGLITRDTYTAPEQVIGGRASATVQSDVYALGCILYEALTGKAPFSGDKDLAEAMIRDELSRPSLQTASGGGVTEAMAEVVLTATKKKASERYATALDMRMALFEGCEPANEGDIKRYLDDLFPPNAIPRATRIQMMRKAQSEKPEPTGRLLIEPPADLVMEHKEREAAPGDDEIEARTGNIVSGVVISAVVDGGALPDMPVTVSTTASAAPPSWQAEATAQKGAPPPQQLTASQEQAPPSWQAEATTPPRPAPPPSTPPQAASPLEKEITAPTRQRATTLLPLPPVQPPPQVVQRTPGALYAAVGLLGGLVIALAVAVLMMMNRSPLPAPQPPVVIVAPPPLPPPPPDPIVQPPPDPLPPPLTPGSPPPSPPPPPVVPKGPGKLVISTTPEMAITVNGKSVGTGNAEVELPAGKHTVVAKGPGTVKKVVTLKPGSTEKVNMVLEKGHLAIEAPGGCTVFVDGKQVGKTPMEPVGLFAGSHAIKVKSPSGVEYKQNVVVRAGLELVLTVQFSN